MRNTIVAILLLLLGLMVLHQATIVRNPGYDALGPGAFPILLSSAFVFLAVLNLALELRKEFPGRSQLRPIEFGPINKLVLGKKASLLFLFLIYCASVYYSIVYIEISSALFMTCCVVLLEEEPRKKAVVSVLVTILFVAVISYVFRNIFLVQLP